MFWLGGMERHDAPETLERRQLWEVKPDEMSLLGTWRVYGVVGYRLPFRRVGGAIVDWRDIGIQAEADWASKITSF